MALIRCAAALLAVLISSCVFAQAKAHIDGPAESKAGNLVVISSAGSKADQTRWIVPEAMAGRYIETGHQLAFSVRDAGQFRFHLIAVVADEVGVSIDVATHTVTVTDGFGECPPTGPDQPSEPIDPDRPQPPAPGFDGLQKLSRDAAASLSDPDTAKALAAALEAVTLADLPAMRAEVASAVERVMLDRSRGSQDKDWLGVWRRPVSDAIDAAGVATSDAYMSAIRAVAAGLREAVGRSPGPQPDPQVRIIFHTQGERCSWCVKWKAEVAPLVDQAGWLIEERLTAQSAPRFTVRVGEKSMELLGYYDMDFLRATVERLSKQ